MPIPRRTDFDAMTRLLGRHGTSGGVLMILFAALRLRRFSQLAAKARIHCARTRSCGIASAGAIRRDRARPANHAGRGSFN